MGHPMFEILKLRARRQLSIEKEVADLQVVGLLRKLVDGVSAVEQLALVAVDIGDRTLAGGGGGEARIEGEQVRLCVELGDVDDVRPDRRAHHVEIVGLCANGQCCGAFCVGHGLFPVGRARRKRRTEGCCGGVRLARTGYPGRRDSLACRRSRAVEDIPNPGEALFFPQEHEHIEDTRRYGAARQRGPQVLKDLTQLVLLTFGE